MKSFHRFPLKSYNTFAVDAYCDDFIVLESVGDAEIAIRDNLFKTPFFILGGGSNVLFSSDFHGTVIHPEFKGISLLADDKDFVRVEVAAGETWDAFVKYALQNNYYGVENLIGIPGNVGSCPVQNIGAYGVEVKDVIKEVHALSIESGKKLRFSNEECHFGYRDSIFKRELKNKVLITSVIFELSKRKAFTLSYAPLKNAFENCGDVTLADVADTVLSIRNSKLPQVGVVGSAGSFFKNPVLNAAFVGRLLQSDPSLQIYKVGDDLVKLSAAQLIDTTGCKSWRDGDVAVFPTQPLVIVNYGSASGKEIFSFYKRVQSAVFDKFEIMLETEVNIL